MDRPDLSAEGEALLLVVCEGRDYDTTAARLLQALEHVPGADVLRVDFGPEVSYELTPAGVIETRHLPVGWDDNVPLDCESCGAPWPCVGWEES